MMNNSNSYELNAIRLQQAVLCVGCDVISDSPHDACLVCGSRSLLPLARVLGSNRPSAPAQRDIKPEAPQVVVLVPAMPHRTRQRGHSHS